MREVGMEAWGWCGRQPRRAKKNTWSREKEEEMRARAKWDQKKKVVPVL